MRIVFRPIAECIETFNHKYRGISTIINTLNVIEQNVIIHLIASTLNYLLQRGT